MALDNRGVGREVEITGKDINISQEFWVTGVDVVIKSGYSA